jgi:hypothetical protein
MEPNTVMVNEPSRLSRSVAHFLKFMELLTANDSDFLYDFDPTNAASLIFVIILVPLSQLERKSTGERTPLEPPRNVFPGVLNFALTHDMWGLSRKIFRKFLRNN